MRSRILNSWHIHCNFCEKCTKIYQFIRYSFYEWKLNGSKNQKGRKKKINRFWVCNKKHFRNDILHSIIIKWSMFMWIFSIPFLHARLCIFFALCSFDSLNKLFIYFYVFFSITFHPISFTIISSYMLFFRILFVPNYFPRNQRIFRLSSLLLVLSNQRSSTSEWSSSCFPFLHYSRIHKLIQIFHQLSFFFLFCSSRHVLSTIILYHVCRERASNHQKKCALIFFFLSFKLRQDKKKKILKLKTKRNFQQFIVVVCHKIKFHNFHRFLCVVRYI